MGSHKSGSGSRCGDSGGTSRRPSVEATALFPRLHVSNAKDSGPGPRAPPRNKMAVYEQMTSSSQQLAAVAQQAAASVSGSFQGGQAGMPNYMPYYNYQFEYPQYSAPAALGGQYLAAGSYISEGASQGSVERMSLLSGVSSDGSAGRRAPKEKCSRKPPKHVGTVKDQQLADGIAPGGSTQSQSAVTSAHSGEQSASGAEQWAWWAWQQRHQPLSGMQVNHPYVLTPQMGHPQAAPEKGCPARTMSDSVSLGKSGLTRAESAVVQSGYQSDRRAEDIESDIADRLQRSTQQVGPSPSRDPQRPKPQRTRSSQKIRGVPSVVPQEETGGPYGPKDGFVPSRSIEKASKLKGNRCQSSSDGDGGLSEQSPPQESLETEVDSILKGQNVVPVDVVHIIGQNEFWKARKSMVRQERIFTQQVTELHRLLRVQQLATGLYARQSREPSPAPSSHPMTPAHPRFSTPEQPELSAAGSEQTPTIGRTPSQAPEYVTAKVAGIKNASSHPAGSAPASQVSQASNAAAAAANVVAAEALAKAARHMEESCAKFMAERSTSDKGRPAGPESRGADATRPVSEGPDAGSRKHAKEGSRMDPGVAAAAAAAGWYPPSGAGYPAAYPPYFPAMGAPHPLMTAMYMQGWQPGGYSGMYPPAGQAAPSSYPPAMAAMYQNGAPVTHGTYTPEMMSMWYAMRGAGLWPYPQESILSTPVSQSVSMPATTVQASKSEKQTDPREDGTVSSKASQLLARKGSPLQLSSSLRRAMSLPDQTVSEQEAEAAGGKRKVWDGTMEPRLTKRHSGIQVLPRCDPACSDEAMQIDGGEDDDADSGEQCPRRDANDQDCDGPRSALPLFPTRPDCKRAQVPIKVAPRAVPATPDATANILLSLKRKD